MPFLLSHILHACHRVPSDLIGPELFLGAQGPDPFFYLLRPAARTTGLVLHQIPSERYAGALADTPEPFRQGFLAHLELDRRLHPFIVAVAGHGRTHMRLEVTLDDTIARRRAGIPVTALPWWRMIAPESLPAIAASLDRLLAAEGITSRWTYGQAVAAMQRNLRRLYRWLPAKRILVQALRLAGIDFRFMYPAPGRFAAADLRPYLEAFDRLVFPADPGLTVDAGSPEG